MRQLLNRFKEVLRVITDTGLNDKLVIVGSWAYWIYQNYLFKTKVLPESLRTTDVDIFIPRHTKFSKKLSLISVFEKEGYRWRRALNDNIDKLEKEDFKIEFLTELKGKGVERTASIKGIGINAIPIRYLTLLSDDIQKIKLYNKYIVNVPAPLDYALHKLLIAQERQVNRQTGVSKKSKDIEQGSEIIMKLDIKEVLKKYNSLPKKWKQKILQSIEESDNPLLTYRFK